jgi:ABC-type transport system involved in cytochrome c biogenesis permease subunit
LPALTLGVAVGVVRLEDSGGGLDALMAVTVLTWGVYAAYLALRRLAGWRGRRAAYLVLAGFVLVVVVRLALPVTHFGT